MSGAPTSGRALVSDLTYAMDAPLRGQALLCDLTGTPSNPPQQILISSQWLVKILKPTFLNPTGQTELMGIVP